MIIINIPIITVVIVKLFAKILIARSPKKYDSEATIENLKPRPKIEPMMSAVIKTLERDERDFIAHRLLKRPHDVEMS